MSKRPSLTSRLQQLDEIGTRPETALNASSRQAEAAAAMAAERPQPLLPSSISGKSLSASDTVQVEQCSPQTVCESDSIQTDQCSKQTVSGVDTVGEPKRPKAAPGVRHHGGFTQVPNTLLRSPGLFEDPFDFMIYMLLYSYSYGFGRDTADMSQSQIEEFAGVSKNRVKRSLDRLIKQRWIKLVHEYERSRIPRRWQITRPEDWKPGRKFLGRQEGQETRIPVSTTDTVRIAQCPERPPALSAVNTLTLSKMNRYQESIQTKLQRNSLSEATEFPPSGVLHEYFERTMPQRKRESELRAFKDLKQDYSVEDIGDCLAHVLRVGLPGGQPCHSPLAFLAVGMGDVLKTVVEDRERRRRRSEAETKKAAEERREREEAERHDRESEIQERAFNRTFVGEDRQGEVIREICRKFGFPTTTGISARMFGINAWWKDLNRTERMEATA
jgi:hypothetical protein